MVVRWKKEAGELGASREILYRRKSADNSQTWKEQQAHYTLCRQKVTSAGTAGAFHGLLSEDRMHLPVWLVVYAEVSRGRQRWTAVDSNS